MTKLFKEDNNFEMLRKFTDSRKLPCIPFLGLYLTDIAYCTAVRKKDPQQAYQQEQNINGILRVIASFQDSNYDHLPRIDCVQKYIESAEFQKEFLSVTEGQLYEKSLEREPESSSKNPLSPTRHFSLPRWSILSGRSSRGGTPSISKLPIREKGSPSLKIKESSPKIKTKSLTPNLTLASKTGRFVKGHKKAQSLGNEAMVMGVDNPTFLSIAPDLSPSMLNSNDSIDKILKNTQSNFRFNTQPSSNLLSAEKPIDLSDISDLMLDSTASSSVFETSVRSDFDVPDDGVFELGKNIETINLNGSSTPRKSTNSSEGRTPRSMRKMLSLRSMRRSENYGKRPRSAEKLKISIDNSDEPLLYELDRSEPEIQGSVHRCVIRGPKSKEIFLKYSQRYFLELRCERDLYKLKPRRMMGFKDGWEVIRGDEEEPNFELHQPSTVDPPALIYMGRDKEENELLIKWGWPEDVWFHVDKLSSAHVYLRLQPGQTINNIPEELIEDCCQMVKANSIEGNKLNNIDVVYTMWANLKKTGNMAVGQVGFHSEKQVKKVRVEKRTNDIVNRLNKTKIVDDEVDYRADREARDAKERQKEREKQRIQREIEQKEKDRLRREQEEKSYDSVFQNADMSTNKDGFDEEDFM
uniref:Coiled-coil domain-containing protein 25 n=1 Tax=Acrobeloides nanus TaxID=290746 RepID=A0A914D3A1_9BILA